MAPLRLARKKMITKCYADLWEWKLFCSTTLNKEGMQTIERVMDLSYGSVMMFCHFHSLLGHVEARGNVHCRHNSTKHNNIVKKFNKLLKYYITSFSRYTCILIYIMIYLTST